VVLLKEIAVSRFAIVACLAAAGLVLGGCGKGKKEEKAVEKPKVLTIAEARKLPPPTKGPAADASKDAMKELDVAAEGISEGAELAKKETEENLRNFEAAMKAKDYDLAENCLSSIEKVLKVLPDTLAVKYRDARVQFDAAKAKR
jgi:hypothetical protein